MRVLIAHPFGIGDVLFTAPLVHALRDSGCEIGFVCNRRTEEMVARCFGVDHLFVFEKDEFRAAWKESRVGAARRLAGLVNRIRSRRFSALLDLSLGWHYSLAALAAGVPRRIGFDYRERGRFLTYQVPISGFHDQPVWSYYLDLLPALNLPIPAKPDHSIAVPAEAEREAAETLQAAGIGPQDRLVALVPGGGLTWGQNARFKQWPAERFAQTGDHAARAHGARVAIIGDRSEEPLCRQVAALMKTPAAVVPGFRSIPALAAALKRCEAVVGNDSGPMHLAAAAGTRTVTLFGPVDASVYGPSPVGPEHRIVARGLACRPCYREFRFHGCAWNNACLAGLEAAEVTAALDQVI